MPNIKTSLAILFFLFITAYILGVGFKMFDYFPIFDVIYHIIGGLFISCLVISYYSSEFDKLSQPFAFFAIIAFAMAVGLFWEFHEYVLSKTLSHYVSHLVHYHVNLMGNLDDTIKDLLNDTFGGILAAIWYAKRRKSG